MTTTAVPATQPQINDIAKLVSEKNTSYFGEDTLADLIEFKETGTLPKKHASQLIDSLLAAPKKQAVTAGSLPAVTLGMYVEPASGEIIMVTPTKDKQRMYCKVMVGINGERLTTGGEIVNWDWKYAPGLLAQIRPEWKMPAELGAKLGIKSGKCIRCKRHLKAAKSVSAMLGPVCITYFA
jgi:hypothetical protein